MGGTDTKLPARYRIQKTLGEGGAGRVYLAEDTELARRVAIKVPLLPGETAGEDWVRRLAEEARVLAGLRHPNIVSLYDFGHLDDGRPYLVFEFVEGTDLASEIARSKRLEPERSVQVVTELLDGLAHAHEHGVVHRDVKPANILIRAEDGRALLADFGAARAASRTSFQTQAGLVIGTPDYLAPEVLLEQPVTPSADVYAAGCVLFECLTGKPPFAGDSPMDVFRRHVHEAPVPAGSGRPALDAVVQRALAKKPEERPAGAAAMAAELAAAMGDPLRAARTKAIDSDAVPARPRTAKVSKPDLPRVTGKKKPVSATSGHAAPAHAPAGRRVPVAALAAAGALAVVVLIAAALALRPRPQPAPAPAPGPTISPQLALLRQCLTDLGTPRIEKLVQAIVKDRGWYDNALGTPQYEDAARIEQIAADAKYPYADRLARAMRRERKRPGDFRTWMEGVVRARAGGRALLERRAEHARLLGDASIPLEERRKLYDALLPFEWLDLLCRSQLEPPGSDIAQGLRALVPIEATLPAGSDPGGVKLVKKAFGLLHRDADRFGVPPIGSYILTMAAFPDFFEENAAEAWKDMMKFRRMLVEQRDYDPYADPAAAAAAGLDGTAGHFVISARVAMLQPAYALELKMGGFTVRLVHPGTEPWYQAMDHLTADGWNVGTRTGEEARARWGRLTARFPAALVSGRPFRIRVQYVRAPGASNQDLSGSLDRYVSLGSLTIRRVDE